MTDGAGGRMVADETEHVWSGWQRTRVHSCGLGATHLLGQVDRLERGEMRQRGTAATATARTMRGLRRRTEVFQRRRTRCYRRSRRTRSHSTECMLKHKPS